MIKIMGYASNYLYEMRPKLVDYIRDNLNNIADGKSKIGSGMVYDLDYERPMFLFVAWRHGKPIGWASVTFNIYNKKVAQIGCFVASEHRRKGIGSRLVKKAKAWSKDRNLKVRSNAWNSTGRRFYNSNDVPQDSATWAFSDFRKEIPVSL